ncbi:MULTISPECIES: hypothetical protein [Streptococcus]|uniref:Uncharacterized protein n=1 Tax=Streptococcus troglodytae TaxID=1111760 RepID=A0A1L7LMA9_9STRE|nr:MULTISPECIES: hypothetical protein [Streptococcus]EMB55237.1 hypothetical protein SMU88_06432 [Streptococcus mutans NLML8]EMC17781.1 hypothetical protein SMU77_04740 [Streptococcus mutans NV1996]EMC23285.1 hypothetical protein SMU81_04412 [Streptococcus mutans SF14]EMC30842.1 hypothetical protein SMU86_04656 [Streptococcus mutans U2A]EMC44620.1 hypothetical protein SMU98_03455 [Streptococcus mutans SM1]
MQKATDFKELSKELLATYEGGASTACKWATLTCAHDIALAGYGTSDPGSACAYMRRVCKK